MADRAKYGGYDSSLYKSPIYMSWVNMKTRCQNKRQSDYLRYGARGISICKKWNDFSSFYEDMGATYKDGLTLDRINNSEGYSKDNCRWVSREIQANNRRSNKIITISGQTMTLSQWIKSLGLKGSTVRQRFYVYGWPIEKSLGLENKIG